MQVNRQVYSAFKGFLNPHNLSQIVIQDLQEKEMKSNDSS